MGLTSRALAASSLKSISGASRLRSAPAQRRATRLGSEKGKERITCARPHFISCILTKSIIHKKIDTASFQLPPFPTSRVKRGVRSRLS